MRRSLFWLLGDHPECGPSLADIHETTLEHARLADGLGFASLWLAEHHFRRISTAANPAVVLSAIAQHTEQIRLGPAISVLPLRNPIHVAEDYALVDILSGGRLNLGVGAGNAPTEFAGFGVDFDGRQDAMESALVELKQRWASAIAGERGEHSLNVAPLQRPAPPIYVATNREERAAEAGRCGDSLLAIVPPGADSLDPVRVQIEAHKRGLETGGHAQSDAEVVVMTLAHVAETEEAARSTTVPALSRFLETAIGVTPPDATPLYDKMVECGTGLFGTPRQVEAQLERFAEIGVEHIAFFSRFGGMDFAAAEACVHALAPQAGR